MPVREDNNDEGYDEVDEEYFAKYCGENGYDNGDFGDIIIDDAKEDDNDGEEMTYDGVFEK